MVLGPGNSPHGSAGSHARLRSPVAGGVRPVGINADERRPGMPPRIKPMPVGSARRAAGGALCVVDQALDVGRPRNVRKLDGAAVRGCITRMVDGGDNGRVRPRRSLVMADEGATAAVRDDDPGGGAFFATERAILRDGQDVGPQRKSCRATPRGTTGPRSWRGPSASAGTSMARNPAANGIARVHSAIAMRLVDAHQRELCRGSGALLLVRRFDRRLDDAAGAGDLCMKRGRPGQ